MAPVRPGLAAIGREGGTVPGARVQVREGHVVTYDLDWDRVIRSIHVAETLPFARDRTTRPDLGLIKIQPGADASENGFACESHLAAPDPAEPRPARQIRSAADPLAARFPVTIRLHYVAGLDKETCPVIICCGGRVNLLRRVSPPREEGRSRQVRPPLPPVPRHHAGRFGDRGLGLGQP